MELTRRDLTPVARFSIALALILAVTAAALAAGAAFAMGRYVEEETATFTEKAVASHFGTVFDDAVFQRNLSSEERSRLETFAVFHFAIYNVVASQFFTPDGTIVFSYDKSETGRRIDSATHRGLASALAGTPAAHRQRVVGDPRFGLATTSYEAMREHGMGGGGDAVTNGGVVRAEIDSLETWVPIRSSTEIIGAAAVWRDLAPIDEALRRIQLLLTAIIVAAALLLWLILRGVYVRSSRQIIEQSKALAASLGETERAYDSTLQALSSALDVRDAETDGHSRRVVAYMDLIVAHLGYPLDDIDTLRRGALLHDVGKIGVPDHILRKPSALTDLEWQAMRRHPDHGARIIADVPFLANVAEIVRAHHERYDGRGYPAGLKGDAIPFGARLFSVADAFDAMTSDRPYRRAMGLASALAEVSGNRGTQFDPEVVDAMMRVPMDDLVGVATHAHRPLGNLHPLTAAS